MKVRLWSPHRCASPPVCRLNVPAIWKASCAGANLFATIALCCIWFVQQKVKIH